MSTSTTSTTTHTTTADTIRTPITTTAPSSTSRDPLADLTNRIKGPAQREFNRLITEEKYVPVEVSPKPVSMNGKDVYAVEMVQGESSTWNKILYGATGAKDPLAVPGDIGDSEYRNKVQKFGTTKKTFYFADENKDTLDAKAKEQEKVIGFNPRRRTKPGGVVDYLKKPENQAKTESDGFGNRFLVIESMSAFIFIPKGDYDKAVLMDTFYEGKPIKNLEDLYRNAKCYGAAIDCANEGWEKVVHEKLAPAMIKSLNQKEVDKARTAGKPDPKPSDLIEENEENIKKYAARLMKQKGDLVIDFENGLARFYAKNSDLNINKDSHYTGTPVPLDDKTLKRIARLRGEDVKYNESLNENKNSNDAAPPKSTSKTPSNPIVESAESDDSDDGTGTGINIDGTKSSTTTTSTTRQ